MSSTSKSETKYHFDFLRRLYEPMEMPSVHSGIELFFDQFSDRVTAALRNAMTGNFLPATARVAQFVTVLPQGKSLQLRAPAVFRSGYDEHMEDLLRRFAFMTYYNIKQKFSFFTLSTTLGMIGGRIMLISRLPLDHFCEEIHTLNGTRNIFKMTYEVASEPNASLLDNLPIKPHVLGDQGIADIAGVFGVPRNVGLLEQNISSDHGDLGFKVRLAHGRTPEPHIADALDAKYNADKNSREQREYHSRMVALTERSHIILCAPQAVKFQDDERHRKIQSSGLLVLIDGDSKLTWDDVEQCYLLAYKLAGLVADAYALLNSFEELDNTRRQLQENSFMAHNLRGPVGDAQRLLVQFKTLSPLRREERIDGALEALAKLSGTVKSILDLNSIYRDPVVSDDGTSADAIEMFRGLVNVMHERRVEKEKPPIQIELNMCTSLSMDTARLNALKILVEELLVNAIEHVDSTWGGTPSTTVASPIVLRVQRGDSEVTVEVANGGIPLSQTQLDQLNRVQPRFRQVRKTAEHYGIGIESCKFIADRLKAGLKYFSDVAGRTVVRVTLKGE